MHKLRQAASAIRNLLSGPLRRRRMVDRCRRGVAPMSVLFYHRVADEHPNDWTISTQQFERHVDHCRRHCELVSLDEVQRRVASGRNDRPTVTFTFDDGYAENCRFALPLLIRHRVPTVYFVATQNVIKQRPFPHDKQAGMALPVNTPEEIVAAADGGIEIGLHTRTHPDFSAITDIDQVRREIIEGKFELEDMIGRPVRYFAVPYGMPAQLTRAVIQVTREAGLAGFCSAFGAYNLPGRDPFHIRRIHGDPQFCRLQNWLSFDSRKLKHEPEIQVDSVVESTPPDAPSHPSSPSIECAP